MQLKYSSFRCVIPENLYNEVVWSGACIISMITMVYPAFLLTVCPAWISVWKCSKLQYIPVFVCPVCLWSNAIQELLFGFRMPIVTSAVSCATCFMVKLLQTCQLFVQSLTHVFADLLHLMFVGKVQQCNTQVWVAIKHNGLIAPRQKP